MHGNRSGNYGIHEGGSSELRRDKFNHCRYTNRRQSIYGLLEIFIKPVTNSRSVHENKVSLLVTLKAILVKVPSGGVRNVPFQFRQKVRMDLLVMCPQLDLHTSGFQSSWTMHVQYLLYFLDIL